MAITHKFTRALPAPTATHSGGFVFLLSAAWFSQSDLGVAGSPINGVNAFANGGGDMQAFSNAGLPDEQPTGRLPLDIVTFVTGGSPSAEVWLLKDTYTAGDKITLGKDDTQTVQPAVTAPFGRNAVYVNEINRMHMESVTPIDSSGNQNSIIANAVTLEAGNIGNALRFNGSSSNIDLGDSILPLGDFTQSVWINPDDLSGFQGIIGNWVSAEDGRTYLGLNGTEFNWDGYATSSNNRGTATALAWQMLTVTKVGPTARILKNGLQQGAIITDNGTPNILHNTFIGALTEGTNNFYDGLIGDNFLSDTYRDNNYMLDLFLNQSDPDNFGTSSEYIEIAGGGELLTIDSGGYSLSGGSLGLIHSSNLIAGSGTYSLTGSQVNLLSDRKLITDNGSYDLTGTDVTLVYTPIPGGDSLVIESGAFNLNGPGINLKASRLISLNNGSYNLTGQNVSLSYASSLVANNGPYALTGDNVGLFANRVIITNNGSYTLSGTSAVLKYSGDTSVTIGTVSAGFAADKYAVEYKQNSITVNFKD